MRSLYVLIVILVVASITGCMYTLPNQTGYGQFAFQINGNTYEILSSHYTNDGGGNMLIQRTDHKVIMRAFDYDQDRTIDKVLIGDLSINEANEIYNTGLDSATLKKRINTHSQMRIFKCPGEIRTCILQTHFLSRHEQFNKLIIIDNKTGEETYLFDNNTDGILEQDNAVKRDEYQKIYENILKNGMFKGRIIKRDNKYWVRPS